jgi:formiminotetrahydrofolate cyclodeaminase
MSSSAATTSEAGVLHMQTLGHDKTPISAYLAGLAERTAVPAGGATAALNAAQAAALLAMTARYCDGPKHAGHAGTIGSVIAEADRLRQDCVSLMAADGESYGAVMAAYALPRDTEERRAAGSEAITAAMVTAAGPPAEVIAAALSLLELAQVLQPMVNSTIAPDVAAAVEALRAAAGTSRTNVEANLSGIADPDARSRLAGAVADVELLEARAGQVIAAVRARYA